MALQPYQSHHGLYGIVAAFGVAGWIEAWFRGNYTFVLLCLLAILALAIFTPIEDAKRLKQAKEYERRERDGGQ